MVTEEAACERAVKNWTQLAKTYGAFGIAIADTRNPGWLYENLGRWIGQRCWLVVKEGMNDPSKVNMFINGPRKAGDLDKPAPGGSAPKPTFAAPPAPGSTSAPAGGPFGFGTTNQFNDQEIPF